MKKYFLFLFLIHLFLQDMTGQTDPQWVILDRVGKMGINTNGNNLYPPNNVLGTLFNLHGTSYPGFAGARNDLFVIYDDTTYFLSRNLSSLGPWFSYSGQPTVDSVQFQLPSGTNGPLYGYVTNVYEGDDPPRGVSAQATQSINNPNPLPRAQSVYPLIAHHDIVPAKDITLIVDFNHVHSQDTGVKPVPPYTLTFNTVRHISTNAIFQNDYFFNVSPVFSAAGQGGTSASFPATASAMTQPGRITLYDSISRFVYFNLTPSSLASGFFPQAGGEPTYRAEFEILDSQGNAYGFCAELMRTSHDPNFLRVDSICVNPLTREQVVYYHLEFKNEGSAPTQNIDISLWFPPHFMYECFEVLGSNLGGVRSGTTQSNFQTAFHLYFDHGALSACDTIGDDRECTGYINFRIKVSGHLDVTNPANRLQPDINAVHFDGARVDITQFYDLLAQRINPDLVGEEGLENQLEWYRPANYKGCGYPCGKKQTWAEQAKGLGKHLKKLDRKKFPPVR